MTVDGLLTVLILKIILCSNCNLAADESIKLSLDHDMHAREGNVPCT